MNILKRISGWYGSLILLALYLASEVGFSAVGGDWGSFLYVTSHFIIMPLLSFCIIVLTFIRLFNEKGVLAKFLTLCAIIVPVFIILLSLTGNTIMMDILDIDFNK
jgi:hypothetical protein